LALIPFITAAVVDAVIKLRLELAEGSLVRRASGHVVVAGLGGIGSDVVRNLYELGVDVVGIDCDVDARGAQVARDLRIPFVAGDASRRDTLLAASVANCRALLALTADDATNLEAALVGRSIRPDLPVVLRLFDGDFADRIQRAFDINTSRSVSYLAAPSFAAHMLGQVTDTIAIGRHVLLVGEITIEPYSELESQVLATLRRPNEAWVVEVTNRDGQRLLASAASGRRLQRADRLLVVATRRGLARMISEASAPTESANGPRSCCTIPAVRAAAAPGGLTARVRHCGVLWSMAFNQLGVVVSDIYFVDPRPTPGQEGAERGVRLELRVFERDELVGSIYSAVPIRVARRCGGWTCSSRWHRPRAVWTGRTTIPGSPAGSRAGGCSSRR
jgi:Trk K+ transport system NAD-binding subunit